MLKLRSSLYALQVAVCGVGFACLVSGAVQQKAVVVQAQQQGCEGNLDFYTHTVQPIFKNNCYRCHGGMNHRGAFKMDTQEGMLRGGKDGGVLVPRHPEQSMLLKLIRHEGPADDPMPMPPKKKISDADIASVTRWIACGANMPAEKK